jgi:hypothetical protein
MAILSLDVELSRDLLAKCGGIHIEGLMEKEGQVNTSFQERHFVLWPREECLLVSRGFRVLYYFDSRTATKAKGRIRIDTPLIEDLTRERNGQCVMRISPETAALAATQKGVMTLDSFLESKKQSPLDARPLTLRWHSSVASDNFEQMEKWSEAFGGHRAEEQQDDVAPLGEQGTTTGTSVDAAKADVMTSEQQHLAKQFKAGMSDQEMQVGTRVRVEGHGLGVYESFAKNVIGGNSHMVRFGADVASLELPKLRWVVLGDSDDGAASEIEWSKTSVQSLPATATTDDAAASPPPGGDAQKPAEPVVQAPVGRSPPRGQCRKRKQNMGFTWPERYIQLSQPEGKPLMGLYVFANEGDSAPRGSSIEKLHGVEVSKGIENWKLQGDKFKLTLSADFLPEKSADFCFETESLRDEFYEACVNLAAGRPWYLSALQETQARAEAEERERQRVQEEIDRKVAEATMAAEAKAEADRAEAIRVAREHAVEEERERAAKEAQEKKIRQAKAAMAQKEASAKIAREEEAAAVQQQDRPDVSIGTRVQVWSESSGQWCDGTVKDVTTDGVLVAYRVGEKKKTKTISTGSKDLKIVAADVAAADAAPAADVASAVASPTVMSVDPAPVGLTAPKGPGRDKPARTPKAAAASPVLAPTATPAPEPAPASFDAAAARGGGGARGGAAPARKGPYKIGSGMRFILPEEEYVADERVDVCEDHLCEHVFVEKGTKGGFSASKWRRHHCRSCGHIFCSKCSGEKFRLIDPESATGATSKERVCDQCFAALTKSEEPTRFE